MGLSKQKFSYTQWGPGWDLRRNHVAFDVDYNGKPLVAFIEKNKKTGKWHVPYNNDPNAEKVFSTRIAAARCALDLARHGYRHNDD